MDFETGSHSTSPAAWDSTKVGVIIPTYNAAGYWKSLHSALAVQGVAAQQILIVDSSSTDGTRELARAAGYRVLQVAQESFDHGGTRRFASEHLPHTEVLILMTQDAIPVDASAFRKLYEAFRNPGVGAAYGRQLPREDALPIERHARLFNYPAESATRTYKSREQFGIKAAFISNSFAAYRTCVLKQVGGFPQQAIVGEDSVVACRMLIAGWQLAYVADAAVVHSHGFTLRKEFARYFDIGVHHARESWILTHFGKADKEGERFLRSELTYLARVDKWLIPVAIFRTAFKLFAYQVGRREAYLPLPLKIYLSGQKAFWRHNACPLQTGELIQPQPPVAPRPSADFSTIRLSN
jgi:rhamnosyltransferase